MQSYFLCLSLFKKQKDQFGNVVQCAKFNIDANFDTPTEAPSTTNTVGIAVGVSIGGVALIGTIIIIVILVKRSRGAKYVAQQDSMFN